MSTIKHLLNDIRGLAPDIAERAAEIEAGRRIAPGVLRPRAIAYRITWQGWLSLLAATATALSALGRMQGNETVFPTLLRASGPFWAAHDVLAGSLPDLVADVSCIAAAAWMLLHNLRAAGSS